MKAVFRFCILTLLVLVPFFSYSQNKGYKGRNYKFRAATQYKYHELLGIFGSIGLANYYGDLCDNFYCMHPRPFLGGGFTYRFAPRYYFKGELNYLRLASRDVWPDRNLSFRSGNVEIYASVMYDFYEFTKNMRKRKKLSPFVFAGLGLVTYNPRTEYNGEWVTLRPLRTEGVSYGYVTPIIPFGVGLKIKHTRQIDFLVEAGYRITFTDHLDDVSSFKFIPKSQFTNQTAADLSNRTQEGDAFHGSRGNPNKNDGYFVFSFKTRYTITSKHSFRPKYNEQHRKVY